MKIKSLFITNMLAISSVAVCAQSAETFRQPYPLGNKLSPNPNFTGEVWLASLSEKKELNVPMGIDTDVNGSCLGEVTYGCAKGLDSVVYITIGTGVGVGVWVNGGLLHGMLHPEGGHILLNRHPEDEKGGICPNHKNCLEGFASGPSIEARWGKKAIELKDDPKVWEIESYYIAQAITDYIMILSPQKIILGGGVMHQEQLFTLIREKVKTMVAGYINTKELQDIDHYIVPASLHDDQGIMGAIKLGLNALEQAKK